MVHGSGQIGVFVEYTSLPKARFPAQLDQSYAVLKWVASHADEFGAPDHPSHRKRVAACRPA